MSRRTLCVDRYPHSLLSTRNSVLSALCALRHALSDFASAVIFLKGFLSVSICVNLLLIAFDALCLKRNLNRKIQVSLVSLLLLLTSSCSMGAPPKEQPQRVVHVEVLGDPALRQTDRDWTKTMEGLVQATSDYYEREFRIRFVVEKVSPWPLEQRSKSTRVLLAQLKEKFPLKDRNEKLDMIIGFTGESVDRYGSGRARVDRLGNCEEGLASYMVSVVTDPFRYQPQSLDIEWDVLAVIHEMGHVFGAEHNDDPTSIMNRDFAYRTEFDQRSREIILKNRLCPFAKE